MKSKIGFVDTEDKGQKEPFMGKIEDQEECGWEFWQTLIIDFLLAFGALSLLKEILVFLMSLKKRG